jgi:hypothetical protein
MPARNVMLSGPASTGEMTVVLAIRYETYLVFFVRMCTFYTIKCFTGMFIDETCAGGKLFCRDLLRCGSIHTGTHFLSMLERKNGRETALTCFAPF